MNVKMEREKMQSEHKFREDVDVIAICGAVFALAGIIALACAGAFLRNYEVFASSASGNPIAFIAVFMGMGSLLTLIGVLMLMAYMKKRTLQKRIYENGYSIRVRITDIRMDTHIKINRGYPYVVQAQYTDPKTGEIYLFQSRHLLHNPSNSLQRDEVPVYVIPPDYKNYYMDIDAILR